MACLGQQAIAGEGKYFNRDLSWLRFNARVLEESEDTCVPLLERARFLAIVSSNLDEFCMVRLAELQASQDEADLDPAGFTVAEQFQLVQADMHVLMDHQDRCWREQLSPELEEQGIHIARSDEWTEADKDSLRVLYLDRIEPVLTPMAVAVGHPFPLLGNGRINIAVLLENEQTGEELHAIVTAPRDKRLRRLSGIDGTVRYALVEDVVEYFVGNLFPGYKVIDRAQMRVVRDGSIEIDEDDSTNLLQEIEEELRTRGHGVPVRVEIAAQVSVNLRQWLCARMKIEKEQVVAIQGLLDLTVLMKLADKHQRAGLSYPPLHSAPCPVAWENPWQTIQEQDVLLCHPYQSFQPIVDFVEAAVADKSVLAIKMTLYRVSGDSPIVRSLIQAARDGKQVTVLLELKARFDEAANIRWARRLERAGAHVIYGMPGLKVHAKMLMIIRREEDGIRRYCHLGTGNYNDRTARIYTDYSYFTCNPAVGRDVSALFNMLTGFAFPSRWERMAVAPHTLRSSFTTWIRTEAENARAGKPARIHAQFNSLVDSAMCDELYAASQAGVHIELVVRGICILRPGIEGLSENICVRSIIGRYLEHNRYYYFHNNGNSIAGISSADWMTRNLDRRVESFVRIENAKLAHVLDRHFQIKLADNCQARVLQSDGTYQRLQPETDELSRGTHASMFAELS